MNQETKPLSFAGGHPEEDQLLLALERELSVEDAARVEQHLGNCWSCRARYDEMQRGILAFVEYREKRYLPSLSTPPDDSSIFRDRLRSQLGERSPVALATRIWSRFIDLIGPHRRMKWVGAVAAAMVGVIVWVHVLVNPRVVSANELLTRAEAAQNPPRSGGNTVRRRIARQKMQIHSGDRTIVRDFEWTIGSSPAQWAAQPDPITWKAPMTAEGFANWRNSVREKIETVKSEGDRLTLDTTASENPIKDAWLVVRANDFHPLEQHLRFSDDRQLDFLELGFQIDDVPEAAPDPQPTVPTPRKSVAPQAVPQPPDLDEVELQLRYTLFVNKWDLGEDLIIGRASGQVTLSGIVSSPEREQDMRAALSILPNVRFSADLPASQPGPGTKPAKAIPSQDRVPLLKEVLDRTFISRDERLDFVNRCLADSDGALSHAWALKRLADKYSEAEEQRLKPESDRKLHEMLRVHLQELGRENDGLKPLLALLPPSNAGTPTIPAGWRTKIISLFFAVQQQDRLISGLVAGSQTNEQNLATASANLRVTHGTIDALLKGLKDLTGDPVIK